MCRGVHFSIHTTMLEKHEQETQAEGLQNVQQQNAGGLVNSQAVENGEVVNKKDGDAIEDISLLEQELARKGNVLDAQRHEREHQLLALILIRVCDGIMPKEAEIETLMSATKGHCQKEIMQMVEKEVIRSSDNSLWCTDYNLRPNGEQVIYCYTGTYWKAVEPALWKDFVGRCATQCGVPESLLMDSSFMKKLYDGMAYNIFKYRQPMTRDDEVWLNMPNFTLEVKADGSVTPREHRREDLFYYCLPYPYDPQSGCPLWHEFLDRVLPDPQAQLLLAEFIGYSMMRSHCFEKMLWLVGPGQNGKSTVLEVVESLLGSENVSNLSLDLLTNDPIMRSAFEHKLVNSASETGDKINASVMKRICSGEAVTVEQKYVNPHETTSYGKVIMATNEFPRPESTGAFFRRILILPFEVTIPDEEKDIHLADKLKGELPGILNWVLSALPGLMTRGEFTSCESSEKALEEYKLESDNVRLFLSEMLEPSKTSTHGQELFNAYVAYCKAAQQYPLGRTKFYKRLDNLTHAGEKIRKVMYFKLKLIES